MDEKEKMICLLSQQTNYIDQLKKEKDILSTELNAFKTRLQNVIEENENLHDSMQAKIISHTLDRSHNVLEDSFQTSENLILSTSNFVSDQAADTISLKWKQEMLELKKKCDSKVAALEAQLRVTNNSLKEAFIETEALKNQLNKNDLPKNFKIQEESQKCQDLFLQTNVPVIERLTKERDDLVKSVTTLRSTLSQAQAQEVELRQEVQKSLSVLEDIQLEKTQLQVERDQFKTDYHNACFKLDEEIKKSHKRCLDATLKQKELCANEINTLQQKIGELMASCSHYENDLEKCAKEKSNILIQLDESRSQLFQAEKQLTSMKAEVEHEVKSALKGYSAAERELVDAKTKLAEELLKTQEERTRYEQDSKEYQLRLKEAESHLLKTQQLNLALTEQLHKVQAKNNNLKQEIKEISDSFSKKSENHKAFSASKIEHLSATLKQVEIEYEKRLGDLEKISQKQSKLILQLKEECISLGHALNSLGQKHRIEVGKLTQELEQTKNKAFRLDKQNKELSQQCVKHGKTHLQMQERLLEVNNRARMTTNQVLELLDRHNQDSKVNDVLNKEVQFLHSYFTEDHMSNLLKQSDH